MLMYKLAQPTGRLLNLDTVIVWIGIIVDVFGAAWLL